MNNETNKSKITTIALCLLISLSFNSVIWSDSFRREYRKITIDFSKTSGNFNRLSGVQGSPWPIIENDRENIKGFKSHKIEICRFPQDCYPNTMTLGGIFKDENAHPSLADSYDFSLIDKHVDAARKAGCQILWQTSYDIGKTDKWMDINLGGRAVKDVQKWKKVVTKCLEHFNNNWKSGFTYAVKYVEFLNEPIGLGGFIGAEHVKRMPMVFIEFIKCINEYNRIHPDTPIIAVGPGIPFSIDQWDKWKDRFSKFFTLLKNKGLSLPVLSFHTYGTDVSPAGNSRLAANYRKLLDQAGMTDTKLWNSEWQAGDFIRKVYNINFFQAMKNASAELRWLYRKALASYALSCKIRWQENVDYSCYYRASKRTFPPDIENELKKIRKNNEGPFFNFQGNAQPLAMQESLTYWLSKNLPLRCSTQLKGHDNSMLTALGLRNSQGDKTAILVCSLLKDAQKIEISFIPPENENKPAVSKIYSSINPLKYFDQSLHSEEEVFSKVNSSIKSATNDPNQQQMKLYKYSIQEPQDKSQYWKAKLTVPPCEILLILLENKLDDRKN